MRLPAVEAARGPSAAPARHPAVLIAWLTLASLIGAAPPVAAQPVTAVVRIGLLPESILEQHRTVSGAVRPELRTAVETGVADQVVFGWRRAAMQRSSLVTKPIRVLAAEEAIALGGRGAFRLAALRPPTGAAAWTEVELAPETDRPEDLVVLEVGGERHVIHQVLEALLVATPQGGWQEPGLARRALFPGSGVPIVIAPFGRPLSQSDGPGRFHSVTTAAGPVEFLLVRSPIERETIPNGAQTARGRADLAPVWARGGDWRDGDRLYIRAALEVVRAGLPPIVLGWKDRTTAADGGRDQWDPAE